jgi:hypothetical protein
LCGEQHRHWPLGDVRRETAVSSLHPHFCAVALATQMVVVVRGGGFHGAGWYGGPPQGWCAVWRMQAAASMAEGTGTHGISGFSLGGGMVPDSKQYWSVLAVGVKGRGLGWSCRCGRPWWTPVMVVCAAPSFPSS